ncbi:DUF3592 domain-containing protein [uncultured Cohaesibacter sp.]|uniref:DUF3592 domain-containing protein n=1 Tax=uncultured Cohaesibacter sp. TaxID=1002546 RepID=UPI0029C62070|nr:DUF3592 domain-containing protein [uncultured Cohaesibacter sp.]
MAAKEKASCSTNSPCILTYFMLAISLGGFIYAGLGWIGLQEAQIPSSWQAVSGQVLESHVDNITETNANGTPMEMFVPKVRYRYEVDGSFFIGDQLSRNHPPRTLKGVAETEIESLGQGTNVTVHYNPDAPEEAVLRKADTIGAMQALSAGLVIALSTLAFAIISTRRPRRSEA